MDDLGLSAYPLEETRRRPADYPIPAGHSWDRSAFLVLESRDQKL
jgi:hypothetical protein